MMHAGFLGYPDVYSWLHDWLPIIFMGLLVAGIFLLMRFMARPRPQRIKPDAAPSIAWADIAGAEEAKEELREVVEYLQDPKRFRERGAFLGVLMQPDLGFGDAYSDGRVELEGDLVAFLETAFRAPNSARQTPSNGAFPGAMSSTASAINGACTTSSA